jgi:hypothetical protein
MESHRPKEILLIGLVGPCSSGKSTLKRNLENLNYSVKHIAQEHSYSPTMWKVITNPDVLIYLHVSYENTLLRRKSNWTIKEYNYQIGRLSNAYQNADIVIDTNDKSIDEVLLTAKIFIKSKIKLK